MNCDLSAYEQLPLAPARIFSTGSIIAITNQSLQRTYNSCAVSSSEDVIQEMLSALPPGLQQSPYDELPQTMNSPSVADMARSEKDYHHLRRRTAISRTTPTEFSKRYNDSFISCCRCLCQDPGSRHSTGVGVRFYSTSSKKKKKKKSQRGSVCSLVGS